MPEIALFGRNTAPPAPRVPRLPSYSAFGVPLTTTVPQMQPAGDIQGIINSFIGSANQANIANAERYSQGLGVLTRGQGQASSLLEQALADSQRLGVGARRGIKRQLQYDLGRTEQQAINRGLGNTTIRNALLDMDRRRADDAMNAVMEQEAARRMQLRQAQAQQANLGSGRIADFIAARNDVTPDLGLIASLIRDAEANRPSTVQQTSRIIGGNTFPSDSLGVVQSRTIRAGTGFGGSGSSADAGGFGGGSAAPTQGGYYAGPGVQRQWVTDGGYMRSIDTSSPAAPNPFAGARAEGGVNPPLDTSSPTGTPPTRKKIRYNWIFHSGLDPKDPMFLQPGEVG